MKTLKFKIIAIALIFLGSSFVFASFYGGNWVSDDGSTFCDGCPTSVVWSGPDDVSISCDDEIDVCWEITGLGLWINDIMVAPIPNPTTHELSRF